MAPVAVPGKLPICREKCLGVRDSRPLGAAMESSGFFTAGTSTATTGARPSPPATASGGAEQLCRGVHDRDPWSPLRHPQKLPPCRRNGLPRRGQCLWVRRWARVAFLPFRRAKYCHNGDMTFVASYREKVPRGNWSMIGTFGPSSAPQKLLLCSGKILGCRGRRLWGRHELEWLLRRRATKRRDGTLRSPSGAPEMPD
jgi:hypothetical protein